MYWLWLFCLYSFLGYLLEKIFAAVTGSRHQVRKCFLLLPLCPVYGLAMLAVLHLPADLTRGFFRLAFYGGLTATAVEYAVHFLYDRLLGVMFWDYSGTHMDLNRRVCVPFAVIWGPLTAFALRQVQPLLHPIALHAPAGAGLALLAAVLVMMAVQAGNRPGQEDCTVVVLGCQVSANGEPTVMLRDRIDAAYDYLTAHPESRCVASGGQNDNEPISEAACIRNTLAARGIDPDRILLEDRSRSTEENLRFTAEIIRQQGLNPRVAIASDNFHQLRASVWARRCGLEAESLGCASWWPLGPGYWAREAVAVVVLEVGSLLQGG